jgi:hypothetical protein
VLGGMAALDLLDRCGGCLGPRAERLEQNFQPAGRLRMVTGRVQPPEGLVADDLHAG